jgi:hypothetical protein
MKAIMVTAPGQVEAVDVPEPTPGPRDIVIRPRACGICGSDAYYISIVLEALFPQMSRPGAKGGGQRFRPIGFGKLAQKPLGMAIAVGSMPSRHHC